MSTTQEIRPIKKLLVANRSEIAIRIFRAASELGIRTCAIYTHEDRYSLHRYKADESYQIGKNDEPLKPYLNIDEIIKLALRVGADAIHPGYGFLSENVHFVEKCRDNGILFIGPRPEVMGKLGDKIEAKLIADKANAPTIKGSDIDLNTSEDALSEANRITYPVMVKAAAGGGGRGMRVVYDDKQLVKAFEEAKGEAGTAFGDDTVFIEKYIENPKHIEIQIVADNYGNTIHLFERDCSVQRRFQKVVEVAPAASLKQETKDQLYTHALNIAKSVGYNNVGTVEFLVSQTEEIFFIEVNPRIQVEHTITEVITGIDIVRSQIYIAQGYSLDSKEVGLGKQEDLKTNGYALQCRITTEDPENGFVPDYGVLLAYRDATGFGIRLDAGNAFPGSVISPFFDSMLVKVSASGRTLEETCQRMKRALREFRFRGVKTNIQFVENVISHPKFQAGEATVKFIEEQPELFQFKRSKDRSTKALKYLSKVIVNGNEDVKAIDENKKFRTPVVPEFDNHSPYPKGTKDLLNELGRDGFIDWLKNEKTLKFTDTTLRDGHQSLLATRMRTKDMLPIVEGYAKSFPQLFSMEVWGGATFDVCLRFLKENPWDRLRLLREKIPNILLQMLIRSSNAVGYTAYPDNLVEKFIEKSWETGIDVFRIFDSLNWIESLAPSIKAVKERTGGIAEVAICYTGNILDKNENKYTLEYYLDLAKKLEDKGADILAIKDMAGLLKPLAAQELITELKKSVDLPIHLHTHDTAGTQLSTYMKSLKAGVDIVDVAVSSMSGLTSQPNFNSCLNMLKGGERYEEFDLKKLNEYSIYWEDVREMYYPFESGLKSSTAEVYTHEIPGGQYSNLRPQARALGLDDQFEKVKENYAVANKMFGNITKVTPSSKVVGDMALFMTSNGYTEEDIMEDGDSISFPDTVINFFKGDLGQPYGGFPKELQKIILKNIEPYTERPNAHLDPIDFDLEFEKFQRLYSKDYNFLDFLSYKLYPTVFKKYDEHLNRYGNVSVIPTTTFFYGLKPNEEIYVELEPGKTIIVKYLYSTEVNADGIKRVFFLLNGQIRGIDIQDESVKIEKVVHKKAVEENEIGTPLQGLLAKVLVKKDQKVKKDDPLFVVEAMKMESTILSSAEGTVKEIVLQAGTMVEQNDLVVVLGG